MVRFLFYRLFYVRSGWLFSAYYFRSKLAKPFKRSLVCCYVVNNPICVSLAVHVLQLHDELIFEVSVNELRSVAQIVKTEMEGAMKLSVVTPVKMKAGPSWGNMAEFEL